MKNFISVITPTIRPSYLERYIQSLFSSVSNPEYLEIIFIGPEYNKLFDTYPNIKFIKDFGHPNRCQQLGLNIASNRYVHFSSDDAIYHEGCFEPYLNAVEKIISFNYTEGGNVAVNNFAIRSCYPSGRFVRPEWIILNNALIERELAQKYNIDCSFEVTCYGHVDLAVRLQRSGELVHIVNQPIMSCSHMPETTGDHGPVHYAQTEHDQTLFIDKYSSLGADIFIDHNNYVFRSEKIWSRRFKNDA